MENKDVASPEVGAKYLSGEVNSEENYRYHVIAEPTDPLFVGITLELKETTVINNIRLLLWGADTLSSDYSYYIEVSTDKQNWTKIIDYSGYQCRSLQDLHFENCAVKYINVVGTDCDYYNPDKHFRLVYLEAYCRATKPRTFKNFLCPTYNVASLEKGAIVLSSAKNYICLDGNYKKYNETEGYATAGQYWIQLAQPFMISYIKFLLLDCDNRSYNFKVQLILEYDRDFHLIETKTEGRSWQTFHFKEHPVNVIRVASTIKDEPLRIVHFECMYKPPEESNNINVQEEAVSADDLTVQGE